LFYIKSKLLLIKKNDGYRNKSQSINLLFCYEHKSNKNKTSLFYLSKSVTIRSTICMYVLYVIRVAHLSIFTIEIKPLMVDLKKKIIIIII